MRLPEETKQEMETTEKVWALLSGWVQPDQADLVRHTVYTFRSLVADKWRDRRVILAGDAAHVMPPFMGQGMCAGMRDAVNLSWKLDMILKGLTDVKLLKLLSAGAKAACLRHYWHLDLPRPDHLHPGRQESQKRDAMFLSGKAPPMAPFPILTDGLLERDTSARQRASRANSRPTQSSWVRMAMGVWTKSRGPGSICSSRRASPSLRNRPRLSNVSAERLSVSLRQAARPKKSSIRAEILGFLQQTRADALLVRPDFYIFATASGEGVERLVEALRTDLRAMGLKDRVPESSAAEA